MSQRIKSKKFEFEHLEDAHTVFIDLKEKEPVLTLVLFFSHDPCLGFK